MRLRCLFVFSAALSLIFAGVSVQAGPGTAGGQLLLQDHNTRSAALAGAFAGASGDLYALGANPAGLHDLKTASLLLQHAAGFDGLATEWLEAGVPVPGLGILALQGLYQGQPLIDNGVADEPALEAKTILFGAAFSRMLGPNLALGISGKLLAAQLGPVDASTLVFDAGLQYTFREGLQVGVAVRNLGQGLKFYSEDPLPAATAAGVCAALAGDETYTLTGLADFQYVGVEDNWKLAAGIEYVFRQTMALRLGYAHSRDVSVKGLSAGLGFKFKAGRLNFSLDYTFLPEYWQTSDFDSENLISLGMSF